MSSTFFLGLDISTTAAKALLIDAAGDMCGVASSEYAYSTPRPLWSEQDPAVWEQGALHSIRRLLDTAGISGAQIAAVGLSGQMHGLTLLDAAGKVLRPAILWNDGRTAAQCDQIRERIGRERFIRITGNDALAGFTAPKILWVRQNEPETFARARHMLLPKDYVRYRMTGEFATDVADGAGTVLMDLQARDWSEEVLAALDIRRDRLPALFEGPQITGAVTAEMAALTGLQAGTPVVAGAGDQAAGAVGVGAVAGGIASVVLGTSGVVFAAVDLPLIEPQGRLHAFCHAVPDRWHLMGVMLSAAGSLRWYRDVFHPGVSYETLLEPAAQIPAGSDGLLFLPYLSGERTPHPDPLARGAFVGATVRHSAAHFTRAVLEGVAFGLRDSFDLMLGAGLPPIRQVRVSGGGARSLLWRKIIADVLDVELTTVNTTEGAAFGSALLAGVAAGAWPDLPAACAAAISLTGAVSPGPDAAAYARLIPQYRALYPALREVFYRQAAS